MKLAAAAPQYGWTDLVYSLVPTGHHSQYPDDLPAFDGSDSHARRSASRSSGSTPLLYGTGQFGATFTPQIDAGLRVPVRRPTPSRRNPLCTGPDRRHPAGVHQRPLRLLPEPVVRAGSRIADVRTYRIPIFNAAR